MWSILTADGKEGGQWDLDEFFSSGRTWIEELWERASGLGLPHNHRNGLDFGCGVGRLTRALADHLDEVTGLDISPSMIELAEGHHRNFRNLNFRVHTTNDLGAYKAGTFDVVCSLLVLQHLPSTAAILTYVEEFVRVLTPGGVILLQLPDAIPPETPPPTPPPSPDLRVRARTALRPRTRLRDARSRSIRALHRCGVSPKLLYTYADWKPEMTMLGVGQREVAGRVLAVGGKIAASSHWVDDRTCVGNSVYFITRCG
ncbi:MAG: class I SAM-dependent methyltransferase [Actinomycetota bacterium]|nr:class I SAM-dependent methyltransferase [Actinomycetota bacterium]